ncbi:hypothetical protein BKI52_41565 [marine bacterium AO1-C]|nr:hypothetical protein BKI52_41565 [marine bacterium AO1-C]
MRSKLSRLLFFADKKFSFVKAQTESNLNKLLKISWWSFFVVITLVVSSVKAQQTQEDWDFSKVKHRRFDQTKIEEYKKDKRFQYQQTPRPKQPSLWFRFTEWLWRNIADPLNNPRKHPVRSTIYYLIIAGILIYAILKLINADLSFSGRRKAQSQVTFAEVEENIHEMDFDQLITEAKAKQNYRRAVRLLYLQNLKKLTDKGLIHWQIDKTNHDYERELAQTSLHQSFQTITLRFEYACYGDFHIDREIYDDTEPIFLEFGDKLAQLKSKSTQVLL